MLSRIKLLLSYYLYWYLFFIIARILFVVYQYDFSKSFELITLAKTFYHGFKLDASASAYLSLLPFFIISVLSVIKNNRIVNYILKPYTILFLIVNIFIVVGDIELYREWNFRIDSTIYQYISNPKMAAASTSVYSFIKLGILTVVLFVIMYKLYSWIVYSRIISSKSTKWYFIPVYILITGALIIPVRGGIGLASLNVGVTYFHNNNFVNHTANNAMWNLLYSTSKMNKNKFEYKHMSSEKAEKLVKKVHKNESRNVQYVKGEKPNVLIIILEGFTSKVIEALGGKKDITPNLNKLSKEGLWFNNFYSAGDRTDKGWVALMGAFPAQPKTSIIKSPKKTQRFSYITQDINKAGYSTSFVYGGTLNFSNYKSFIYNAGFQNVISLPDFKLSQRRTKWGVYDEDLFNKLLQECNKASAPFYNVCMTLTSHQPYDIPTKPLFSKTDDDHKFMSSCHYADKCLGEFIALAKQTEWWKNTLVIITADHGSPRPDRTANSAPLKFHIPMLWTGGAIDTKKSFNNFANQTDLSETLAIQLGLKNKDYKYGKNFLAKNPVSNAYYVFNHGFGFLNDTAQFTFNNNSNKVMMKKGKVTDEIIEYGKAIQQVSMGEFKK